MTVRRIISWAFAGAALMAAILLLMLPRQDDQIPGLLRDVVVDPPQALRLVDLTDQRRRPVTEERLKGHWTFVMFGYMSCPDVCPLTLTLLGTIKKAIVAEHVSSEVPFQVFFVSVDPGRDTLDGLGEYLAIFDPEFIGVTGEAQAIGALERQMGAFHRYGPKNASGYYTVQHSAELYLINPQAGIAAKFQPPVDPKLVARQFLLLADRYQRSVN